LSPRLTVFDDQRVAFPLSARVAHPEVQIVQVRRPVQEDGARDVGELIRDQDVVRCLRDFKGNGRYMARGTPGM